MKYMQRWEEMELEKDEARAEGRNSIDKLMDEFGLGGANVFWMWWKRWLSRKHCVLKNLQATWESIPGSKRVSLLEHTEKPERYYFAIFRIAIISFFVSG